MNEIWITSEDIMTIAKIYDLNYQDAIDKIRQDVEASGKKVVFV